MQYDRNLQESNNAIEILDNMITCPGYHRKLFLYYEGPRATPILRKLLNEVDILEIRVEEAKVMARPSQRGPSLTRSRTVTATVTQPMTARTATLTREDTNSDTADASSRSCSLKSRVSNGTEVALLLSARGSWSRL